MANTNQDNLPGRDENGQVDQEELPTDPDNT